MNAGNLVIMVAMAQPGSLNPKRYKDNATTRLAQRMCLAAGAKTHYYGHRNFSPWEDRAKTPYVWLITMTWKKK